VPTIDDLDTFWAEILSSDPARIRRAAEAVPPKERESVITHLRSMATRDDWTAMQRANAWAALVALGEA
jgi:hypothetical protein